MVERGGEGANGPARKERTGAGRKEAHLPQVPGDPGRERDRGETPATGGGRGGTGARAGHSPAPSRTLSPRGLSPRHLRSLRSLDRSASGCGRPPCAQVPAPLKAPFPTAGAPGPHFPLMPLQRPRPKEPRHYHARASGLRGSRVRWLRDSCKEEDSEETGQEAGEEAVLADFRGMSPGRV